MKKRNGAAARAIPAGVFDVQEFLAFAHISRATLYDLWKEGRGPRQIKIGRRTLISHEAAADWVRQMESGNLK